MKAFLLAASLVLATAAAACGGATATTTPRGSSAASAAAPSAATSASTTTAIVVKDFKILPATVSIAGPAVTLAVTNEGPTVHNVTIRDGAGKVIAATSDLNANGAQTITAQLQPGAYVLFCSLPGHESLGTKAALTVTAP